MHFSQEASKSQVEGFEDADVGSEVVSQSHGCRRMRNSAVRVGAVVLAEVR